MCDIAAGVFSDSRLHKNNVEKDVYTLQKLQKLNRDIQERNPKRYLGAATRREPPLTAACVRIMSKETYAYEKRHTQETSKRESGAESRAVRPLTAV